MIDIRQNSFAGGEIAPSLYGRLDLAKYLISLRTCRNFIVTRHGSLVNRPGTKFVAGVKDSTKKVRLVPFLFSDGQNFVLEFGDLYMRVIYNGGQVTGAGAPAYAGGTAYAKDAYVTSAAIVYRSLQAANVGHTPASSPTWWVAATVYEITTPYLEAELPHLKFAQVGDVVTICHKNHAPAELRRYTNIDWRTSPIDFNIPVGASRDVEPGCGVPVYTLPEVISGHAVKIAKVGGNVEILYDWGLAITAAPRRYEYCVTQLLKDSVSGVIAESQPFYFSATLFVNGDLVGAQASNVGGGAAHWLGGSTYALGDVVRGRIGGGFEFSYFVAMFGANTGNDPELTSGWWMPKMMQGTADVAGIWLTPLMLSLSEHKPMIRWWGMLVPAGKTNVGYNLYRGISQSMGRLATLDAGTKEFIDYGTIDPDFSINPPQGANPFATDFPDCAAFYEQRRVFGRRNNVLASKTGDFTNFDPPLISQDNSPLDMLLAALHYEEVRWLVPSRSLLAGTNVAPWAIGGVQGNPLTPTSRSARPQVAYGSSWLDPVLVGGGALFVQEMGNLVREVIFDYSTDAYQSIDLSVFAAHLFESREVVAWTYAQAPFSVVWAVRDDGKLLGLSYDKASELVAWHWHDTVGSFEDACSLQEGKEHAVYVVVNRAGGRYIERFTSRILPRINGVVDVKRGVFLDSSLIYDAAPATVFSGLDHLEGETVGILADGSVLTRREVVGGSVDISDEAPDGASVVTIGLPYASDMETLDLAIDRAETKSKVKRVVSIDFEVLESVGLKLGPSFDKLREWRQRSVADSYGNVPTFTGIVPLNIPGTYNMEGRAVARQDDPLPCTIIGFTREADLGDD